ncbi:OsmC family protein [Halosolutus halophilus]|uniref:OsmC family protein n=1 Tax=Halosolutus halophilus TaxID=1552990 RepID=UPI0022353032|nr:OsmC family protein [Halosolutus halophilus]
MSENDLQAEQKPLKETYEEDPEKAQISLSAKGEEQSDVRSCSVDIGRAMYEAELHEGAAGPGTGACSGDLLLGALAACSQLTAQAVADAFDTDAEISTAVHGDLDLRGTLGIADDVPVGFQDVQLEVSVDGDVDSETANALQRYTEQYCVVLQTLSNPPEIETEWSFD